MPGALRWMVFTACLAAACADEAEDPGPHDIDGWIGRCEDRCSQEQSCDPEQLLFDHGDLDNCIHDCRYYLERDENVAFVGETPAACLEALYAQMKCVYGLSCEDLDAWEEQADGAPCADEAAAAADACDGIDAADFLEDCGWPQEPDGAL
jgi:hypothetical protein